MPFAVPLAMWAGLADLIPAVGSYLGAIPAIVVAFFVSPVRGLITLGYFIGYQQFENYVLVPKVMQNAVNLSPAAVIVSTLIGGSLFGFAGALLALPVAATVKVVIVETWLRERGRRGDQLAKAHVEAEVRADAGGEGRRAACGPRTAAGSWSACARGAARRDDGDGTRAPEDRRSRTRWPAPGSMARMPKEATGKTGVPDPEPQQARAPRDALGPAARVGRASTSSSSRTTTPCPWTRTTASAARPSPAGRWFPAHEAWETAWKQARGTGDEELFKGLSQMGAGYVHLLRGNAHGAMTLLRRAAGRVGALPRRPSRDRDARAAGPAAGGRGPGGGRDPRAGRGRGVRASHRVASHLRRWRSPGLTAIAAGTTTIGTRMSQSSTEMEWKGRTGPFTVLLNPGVFSPTHTSRTLADALEIGPERHGRRRRAAAAACCRSWRPGWAPSASSAATSPRRPWSRPGPTPRGWVCPTAWSSGPAACWNRSATFEPTS